MDFSAGTLLVPGTRITRESAGGLTGAAFVDRVFFLSDGIMLADIKRTTGIDGTTLQNWTKRGWVDNPVDKKYTKEQYARILIINMLRDCMRLDRIVFLPAYVNGRVYGSGEGAVTDLAIYDLSCRLIDGLPREGSGDGQAFRRAAAAAAVEAGERVPGSRRRLAAVLEIIVTGYTAACLKRRADALTEALM